MTFVESLSLYTAAQKTVAYGFVGCGALLLISAALTWLAPPNASPLWQGFRVGAIVFGLLILVGGLGYARFNNQNEADVAAGYQADAMAQVQTEHARMQKVVSDFPVYQIVFAVIVAAALATALFAQPYWAGFAYPPAFLFLAVMLIEAHSHVSIAAHAETIAKMATTAS